MTSSESFTLNAWYAIGWDTEIGRSLTRLIICGIAVVAYRRFDRTTAIIEDACWHRGLPLSMGKLVGDEVECAYHGLRFTPEGRCAFVPGQDLAPATACVRSFPINEKHRLV
jgi:vanillate O-demethylase monooxygenase subunit